MNKELDTIKYYPFQSNPTREFWVELSRKKIDEYKLNDDILPINGKFINIYNNGIFLKEELKLDEKSFETSNESENDHIVKGHLKILNTKEDFKKLDKASLLNFYGTQIRENMYSSEIHKPLNLYTFIMIVYADLKYNKYIYWVGMPSFIYKTRCKLYKNYILYGVYEILDIKCPIMIVNKKKITDKIEQTDLINFNHENILKHKKNLNILVTFPVYSYNLKNLIFYLEYLSITKVDIIHVNMSSMSYTISEYEFEYKENHFISSSLFRPEISGWEMSKGKMKPKIFHLTNTQFSNLNLKLMKWRALPALNISCLSSMKCLLIGAGTLGCHVSRSLLSWGIQNITFIDNGIVSPSNPLRQTLYQYSDIGKPKATQAAYRLKQIIMPESDIYLNKKIKGYKLEVPMPGHIIDQTDISSIQEFEKNLTNLIQLFEDNDIVFVLTDSRESRWLPTLLGQVYNKTVINVALGFDTFLIIKQEKGLGCYFCNDAVAPENSSKNRTLDQQCTVTRPGVSNIAASIAVELLIGIVHKNIEKLGTLYNQIRGTIGDYKYSLSSHSNSFKYCTSCSLNVIKYFEVNPVKCVLNISNNPGYLKEISGLNTFYEELSGLNFDYNLEDETDDD